MPEFNVNTTASTGGGFWSGVGDVLSGIGNAFATVVGGAGQVVAYGGDVAWAGLNAVGDAAATGLTWTWENQEDLKQIGGALWGMYSGYEQYEKEKDAARDARRMAALNASMSQQQTEAQIKAAQLAAMTGRPQGGTVVVSGGDGQGQILTYVVLAAVAILLLRK